MSFFGTLVTDRRQGKEKAAGSRIEVFLIPTGVYQEKLLEIVKNAVQEFKGRLLYVSINKPAEKIIDTLRKNGIATGGLLFIDAVSKDIRADVPSNGVVYIDSPQNFGQFNAELSQIIEKERFECIIFDSLSTILLYQPDLAIVKFAHDLIAKLIVAHACGKFTCLIEDMNSTLVKDVSMFADDVIDMGKQRREAVKDSGSKKGGAIAKLEKEMQSIKEAYALKFLSEESYLTSKERLEAKLERLRNKR